MTTRRRILLALLTPRIPLPQVFATWNPADKHADITLSGGDLIATKSTTDAADWAGVRATVPMSVGQHYWETKVNFTGTADVAVGLAYTNWSLFDNPGDFMGVARAVAVNVAGDIRVGGSTVASIGALADGGIIRHWYNADDGTYVMANGAGAWVDALPFVGFLSHSAQYQIASVKRPVGSTGSCTVNSGASPFVHDVPDGANAGVYTVPSEVTTLYVGSEGFDAVIDGSPVHFEGRLAGDQDVEIEREGSCWVWGDQTVSRRGQLVIINNDRALNAWQDYIWRDAGALLLSGYEGDSYDDFVPWAYSRGDSIEATRDRRLVITLADPLAWLDRPFQPTLYPADQANLQLAGQPLPVVYGKPLYCTAAKLSTNPTERDYQLHDSSGADALDKIAAVYDSGDIFNGPDDPFTPADIITAANGGNFTGNSGSVPPIPLFFSVPAGAGVFGATDFFKCETSPSFGFLHCKSQHAPAVTMEHTSTTLLARTRYRITFTCTSILSPGSIIFRAVGSPDVSVSLTTTGAKSVALYVRDAAKLRMVMQGDGVDVYISTLRVSAEQVIDWTYWNGTQGFNLANSPYGKIIANPEGTLTGLEQYIEDICTRVALPDIEIAGVTYTGYSAATALSVQARNMYYLIDEYVDKPTTAIALLRMFMDAWCGCAVPNRLGIIDFKKLTEPSNTSVLTLDKSNIKGGVIVTTDRAKELTIRLSGAKNHTVHTDGEIVSGVPDDLAAALQKEYGMTAEGAPASAGPVSSAYAAAIAAKAKGLPFRLFAQLQAEANRVATLFRPQRNFYELTALLSAVQADSLEYGDTVCLIVPETDLDVGKNLIVKRVRSRFFTGRCDLKLWG